MVSAHRGGAADVAVVTLSAGIASDAWLMPRERRPWPLRAVLYNALSLVGSSRAREIAYECNADLLLITGTCVRAVGQYSYHAETLGSIRALHLGWRSDAGPGSNRHAGVSVIWGRQLRGAKVREVRAAPRRTSGRCGAVRLQMGPLDVSAIVAYPPPLKPSTRTDESCHKAAMETVSWIREGLDQIPARSTPILGLDNACFGTARETEGIIGVHNLYEKGTATGKALETLFVDHGLSAVTTFHARAGPTFFHPSGSCTSPDQ